VQRPLRWGSGVRYLWGGRMVGFVCRISSRVGSARGHRGASRRLSPSRHTSAWVAVTIAMALLTAACSETGRPAASPTTTTAPKTTRTSAPPAPIPPITTSSSVPGTADTGVLDLTWISDSRGWALTAAPCSSGTCGELLSTTDGGVTWAHMPPVPAWVSPSEVPVVANIRFADARLGYAWGDGGDQGVLFVTSDGGRSWIRQASPRLLGLEIGGGWAFRMVAPMGFPGEPMAIDRAPVGSSAWQRATIGLTGDFGGRILTSGQNIYVDFPGHTAGGAPDAHSVFAHSADGGSSWSNFDDPCGTVAGVEQDAVISAAGPGSVFEVLCVQRTGARSVSLRISYDGGRHFGVAHPTPIDAPMGGIQLAVPAAGVSVIAMSGNNAPPGLIWSGNAGQSWQTVLTAPRAAQAAAINGPWLGFEDSQVGRFSYGSQSLWTSADQGRTWRESKVG
jgi:hypothetical protein